MARFTFHSDQDPLNGKLNFETVGVFADQMRNYFKIVSVLCKLRNSNIENEFFDNRI